MLLLMTLEWLLRAIQVPARAARKLILYIHTVFTFGKSDDSQQSDSSRFKLVLQSDIHSMIIIRKRIEKISQE